MLPKPDDLMFCIMRDGEIIDGAHGLAIGNTEQEAWERALDPAQNWSIEHAKRTGSAVARCALMVINAPEAK